jgi:hypothetical protein
MKSNIGSSTSKVVVGDQNFTGQIQPPVSSNIIINKNGANDKL